MIFSKNRKYISIFFFRKWKWIGPHHQVVHQNKTQVVSIKISMIYSTNSGVLRSRWPWSYDSWIYNYLCNKCLSPLKLWVWIPFMARCSPYNIKVCQWLATGRWFSPDIAVFSTNKTDGHDITKILLKVLLNTIKPNHPKLDLDVIHSGYKYHLL